MRCVSCKIAAPVAGVVHVDAAANERVYGRSVSAADILNWRAKPPNSFSPLIEVLISCEEGKYDRASSDGDSSEASVHGLRPLSSLPLVRSVPCRLTWPTPVNPDQLC